MRRLTWQTKGTQIWLCKCKAAERLDSIPGETTAEQAEPTPLETRAQREEMEIGGAEGGGGRKRGGIEGWNDHRETERDFPSSSWEILSVSLQPERTVTHD